MKVWQRLSLQLGILAVLCAPVGPVLAAGDIDFDDLGGAGVRPVAPDRYAADGLRLETDGAGLFVFGPSAYAASPPDWLYASQTSTGENADASVVLRFVSPLTGAAAVTDDVSFAIADPEPIGPWTVRGYDLNNNEVALVTRSDGGRARVAGKAFHRVVFTPSGDFDGIDSLSFNEPLPPASLALLTPVPFGHAWRYLHPTNGVDPATSDPDFHATWFRNDGAYNGPNFFGPFRAPLGYGTLDLRPLATNIGTPASGNRHSAYFTTTFHIADVSLVRSLSVDILADDGAFIYLNGQLAARHNIAPTALDTYRQTALSVEINGISTEQATFNILLDPSLLVTGTNFLAVSVHNESTTSSDLGLDLQLTATVRVIPEPASGLLAVLMATAAGAAWPRTRRRWAGMMILTLVSTCGRSSAASTQPPPIVASPYHLLFSRPALSAPGGPATGNYSGVAYSGVTHSLFVVDNNNSYVYEYDLTGAHRRTVATTGFDDVEGIVWLGGHRFGLLEEKTTHINIVDITPTTTLIARASLPTANIIRPDLVPGDPSTGSLNPTGGNTGLEGIAYDSGRNLWYVAKEKAEGTPGDHSVNIFEVAPNGYARVLFDPAAPHGASSLALTSLATDVADLYYDRHRDHLLVLSQESRRIIEVTLDGEVVGTRFQPGTQAEGIVFTPDARDLYVVGESREFFHYQSSPELVALVAPGARWKYRDDGSNQGVAWRAADFNDTAWAEGPAELGYGDADEATVVRCGPVAGCTSANIATTYFRHAFNAADVDRIVELSLGIQRDDAAAVYLNGVQIYRDATLPANAAFNQFAGGAALLDPDEDFFVHVPIAPALLVPGRNVLAVEIHQWSSTDTDLSFNAQLIARYAPIPEPPTVTLTIAALAAALSTAAWRGDCKPLLRRGVRNGRYGFRSDGR